MELIDDIVEMWDEEDLSGLVTPTSVIGMTSEDGDQPAQVFKFRGGCVWIK
jgi:hypothetical protein